MRGKKTGALLVALAVAVLLSSRGEKETGRDRFRKTGGGYSGHLRRCVVFCTGGVFLHDALFCRKPANG